MKVHPQSLSKTINLKKRVQNSSSDEDQICYRQLSAGEAIDRLNVMKKLEETTYACQQYFPIWKHKYSNEKNSFMRISIVEAQQEENNSSVTIVESTSMKSNDLNHYYRSIMCEWGYQLIDFFEADREVVAVAFSYLDRLLEHFVCDKKIFRLATVTSIYLAVNLICCKELPMNNLVDLCQYEFKMQHFIDMKLIILRTLGWKLHPPTSKSILDHLCLFLPLDVKSWTKESIIQQSSFLVELSISDSYFIGKKHSHIAFAAILNAMDSNMHDNKSNEFDETSRSIFIHHLSRALETSPQSAIISNYQKRLLELYKRSKQYQVDILSHKETSPSLSSSRTSNNKLQVANKPRGLNGCINNIMSRGKLWNSFQTSSLWK